MAPRTETKPMWLAEPEPHDFAAADHFLQLILHNRHVAVALAAAQAAQAGLFVCCEGHLASRGARLPAGR